MLAAGLLVVAHSGWSSTISLTAYNGEPGVIWGQGGASLIICCFTTTLSDVGTEPSSLERMLCRCERSDDTDWIYAMTSFRDATGA